MYLFILLFTVLLGAVGVGILTPLIPQLLTNSHSAFYILPSGVSLSTGFIIFGLLTACYPFAQFIAAPILGQISDTIGRKKILLVSLIGTAIAYLLFVIGLQTKNIPLLFISRLFDGFTGGNIGVVQPAIADITKPEDRSKRFGLVGGAFGIGLIIGPFLGSRLADPSIFPGSSVLTPFIAAFIFSIINALLIGIFLPETLKKFQINKSINWGKSLQNIINAYHAKRLRILFITNFFVQSGFAFVNTFAAVFVIHRFHFTVNDVGNLYIYIGIWIIIGQTIIVRIVQRVLDERSVLKFSLIGAGLFILTYFIPTNKTGLLFVVPGYSIFVALTQANIPALISRNANESEQGEVLGINSSVFSLAQTLPPILAGYGAGIISYNIPFIAGSVLMFIGGLLFLFAYKAQKF